MAQVLHFARIGFVQHEKRDRNENEKTCSLVSFVTSRGDFTLSYSWRMAEESESAPKELLAADEPDDAASGASPSALDASESDVSGTEFSSAEISPSAAGVPVAEAPRKENRLNQRPFRVKLRGSVLALLRLPNRRDVRSAIHQISITGGVVHVEKPLDENLTVEMIFHMGGATIRAKAQLLFPMWATQGWMQPFRFLELSNESRENLGASLKALVGDKTAAAGA